MAKKKKSKELIATPVSATRSDELIYQRKLMVLAREMSKAVRTELLPYLKANEAAYVIDAVSDDVEKIIDTLQERFAVVINAGFAENTATSVVNGIETKTTRKFVRSVRTITGIDPSFMLASEGLTDFVNGQINKNVQLIKSLPEEYFKDISTIVNNGSLSGARSDTIAKQITAKTGSTDSKLVNRIKTIARNEVQTITSQINLRRSEALGITEGIYRTSEDEKVRKCHKELNGVRYKLNKGAWSPTCEKWIQPGITDINCRCRYSPVIELENL